MCQFFISWCVDGLHSFLGKNDALKILRLHLGAHTIVFEEMEHVFDP
jgi:hypothetical protein